MLGAPDLNELLQVLTEQSGGKNYLSQAAALGALGAAPNTAGCMDCKHMASFSSGNSSRPSPQGCSRSILHPACVCAWECPDPGAGPCLALLNFMAPVKTEGRKSLRTSNFFMSWVTRSHISFQRGPTFSLVSLLYDFL